MVMIRIGTDCSGIEAPIQALKQLRIPYIHEWSCEIDKYARMSIKANYDPKILFEDIRVPRKLPEIDLYVCGFPCQSFSCAGDRKGFKDPRGMVFFDCLRAIRNSNPKVFVLENVKGLLSIDNGATFTTILKYLEELKKYNIYWKVLNTKDYGIPQNRERVFIVGIAKKYQKREFVWPKPCKMRNIDDYIDKTNTEKTSVPDFCKNSLKKFTGTFVDLKFVNVVSKDCYKTYCPTIVANNYLWCNKLERKATNKEKLSLQGFPSNFRQVVSDAQLSRQIGNSMSVNVLKKIFKSIFMDPEGPLF